MAAKTQMIWRAVTVVHTIELPLPEGVVEDGVTFRQKRQIPIVVDGGTSVRNIVGSLRNLRVQDGALRGQARWASDEKSQRIKSKVDAGILRYRLEGVELEYLELRTGQRWRHYQGPVRLITKWQPLFVTLEGNDQ